MGTWIWEYSTILAIVTRRQLLSLPASLALVEKTARSQSDFPGVAYRQYARGGGDQRELFQRSGAVQRVAEFQGQFLKLQQGGTDGRAAFSLVFKVATGALR